MGTACSQVRWQLPPITSRSPWPRSCRSAVAAAARAQQQRAGRAERDDRDHGVLGAAAPDRVAVPRDAVPAVPVQAQPGGQERLAELGGVVLAERLPGLVQHGIGKRRPLGVEADQPGDVDHLVIHPPLLRAPRDRAGQPAEQRVGAADPAGPDVDPRPPAQRGPPHRGPERPRACPVRAVQQRPLKGERHDHEPSLSRVKYQFEGAG